jgi:hypothetical protein
MVAKLVQRLPEFDDLDPRSRSDTVAAAWLHDVLEDTTQTVSSAGSYSVHRPSRRCNGGMRKLRIDAAAS